MHCRERQAGQHNPSPGRCGVSDDAIALLSFESSCDPINEQARLERHVVIGVDERTPIIDEPMIAGRIAVDIAIRARGEAGRCCADGVAAGSRRHRDITGCRRRRCPRKLTDGGSSARRHIDPILIPE